MSGTLKTKACIALAVALGLVAGGAAAQTGDDGSGLHPFIGAGLTFGGDTIVTATYTDGTSQDIDGGELIHFGGGVQWNAASSPLSLAFSINYHADTATAKNGDAEFKRYPLEAIAYYRASDAVRFGLGVRYVLSPAATYSVSGSADEKLEFDNAVGGLVEAGYGVSKNFWVSLRVVSEKYQPKTLKVGSATFNVSNTKEYDGSHVGINAILMF